MIHPNVCVHMGSEPLEGRVTLEDTEIFVTILFNLKSTYPRFNYHSYDDY